VDDVAAQPLAPNWNVAPTDPVYVIAERDGKRILDTMRWGLVPYYAKDDKKIHINARLETVDTSAAFRESFARRRCLIPADGFYEWEPADRGRSPHGVYRADGFPMTFAGIWSTRKLGEVWDRSCSIITTSAAGAVRDIHDRMPVALVPESWDAWLDRDLRDPETARGLAQGIDPDLIMEHEVSKQVNSVRNNGPELREKTEPETLF
jgi:putative SOS response-associated peptidase YedK